MYTFVQIINFANFFIAFNSREFNAFYFHVKDISEHLTLFWGEMPYKK